MFGQRSMLISSCSANAVSPVVTIAVCMLSLGKGLHCLFESCDKLACIAVHDYACDRLLCINMLRNVVSWLSSHPFLHPLLSCTDNGVNHGHAHVL